MTMKPDSVPGDVNSEPRAIPSENDREARRKERILAASRLEDESRNPCLKESKLSLTCMSENDFDRERCNLYFKNYRNCRDFWKRVQEDRSRRGIQPALPVPEDRESARREYYRRWAYKYS